MDPNDMAMQQLHQMAAMSENQLRMGKLSSALELNRIEAELALARARQDVATADIERQELLLSRAGDEDRAYYTALITAAKAMRDAHANEVAALEAILEIKKEYAELSLAVDPTTMTQIANMIGGGMFGHDEDNPGSQS